MATQAPYKQLQPFSGGVSRDLQFWAQEAGARRREGQAKKEFAYQVAKDDRERKDKLYDKYIKPLNPYDTKSESLNEGIMRILSTAQDKTVDLLKTLEDKNASREDQIKARIGLEKINTLPDRLELVTDYYTKQKEAYDKARGSDLWWENPEFEKFMKEGFKGIEFGLDENYDPVVSMRDLDGDGVLDVQTFDAIRSGTPQFDFMPKFNEESAAKVLASSTGLSDNEIQTGYRTIQEKGLDQEKLDLRTKKLYYKEDGTPSVAALSSLRKAGLEETPENVEKVREEFKRLTNAISDELYKDTTDLDAMNAANREARLREQTKKSADGNVILPSIEDQSGNSYSNAEVLSSKVQNSQLVLELSVPKTKSLTKTEYTELQDKVDNAKTEKERQEAAALLRTAQLLDTGGAKVTYPEQNERKTIKVKESDEDWVTEKIGVNKDELPEREGPVKIEGF